MSREFPSRVDSLTDLRASEAILRYSFERDANLTNPERGFVEISWVNQLIDIKLQKYAASIIVARVREKGWNINKIAGVPNMGGPVATSVADLFELQLAPGRKGNGTPGSWKSTVIVGDVPSFTTAEPSRIVFNGLFEGDEVLFVDDFIAEGKTMVPILEECERRGIKARVATYCAKLFQPGMALIRAKGYDPIAVLGIERDGDRLFLSPPHF